MCLAVPGKIQSVSDDEPLLRKARVAFAGVVREVSLACLPEARPGDWVLVHVGLAIATLDEEEALRQLDDLRAILALSDEGAPSDPGGAPAP